MSAATSTSSVVARGSRERLLDRLAVPVDGATLSVQVTGEGPDVLLVHGFPDDSEVWRRQVPALAAAGYRVITLDTRGCGESDAPGGENAYKLSRLVDDLAVVLDSLDVAKVKLVGHDWGAVIGWQFCMTHAERVERYAALSVGHPTAYASAPFEQKLMGYYILLFQLRGAVEWLLSRDDWCVFRALIGKEAETERWISQLSRPGRLTAALNYYRANVGLFMASDWPPVSVPVMGLWSDRDIALCEAQVTSSARHVAGPWRYHRLHDVGHWLQLEASDTVNKLLLSFFREEFPQ